ncbi:MAG TPA: tryptophan transporter [Bacillota bacterium]|nr:tryptophan transporter [Bacillota bacterium]
MTTVKQTKKMSAADVVLVGALIAAGAVLRLFCPPIFGITPNFLILMYCVAILIIKPNLRQTIGIAFVAAAVSHFTTKSMIPYLNFVSEPIGALVVYSLVNGLSALKISKFTFKPFVVTLFGTLASGLTYVTVLKTLILFVNTPKNPAFLALLTVVITTAVINSVLAQLIYYPIVAASGKKLDPVTT